MVNALKKDMMEKTVVKMPEWNAVKTENVPKKVMKAKIVAKKKGLQWQTAVKIQNAVKDHN